VVSGGGSSMSVQERFATLTKRFLPEKAKGVDARFQFDLSGSGGGKWYVEIKGGKITVKEGSGPNPTVTLKASAEDYLKIANGEMSKTWAFIRGKVKVDGDRDVLGKFDQYFKDPK
jgi:putative sterol carrier protein